MLLDLIEIWNKHNKTNDEKYQNTFAFTSQPKCVFVRDRELTPAHFYSDLEELHLSELEQLEADKKREQILSNGGYDGNQFFIKNLIYDPNCNLLYINLLRTKFSVLSSLSIEKRQELGLYKVGVFSPTITKDNEIVFIERSRGGFYSVVSGLLEQKDEISEPIGDLLKTTAIEENSEELYGDNFDFIKMGKKFKFIGALFTKSRGFIEFVVNFQDNKISTKKFLDIFKNSTAKDRDEHTQNYFTISLGEQIELEKTINEGRAGSFLYTPITICNSKTIQSKNIVFTPEHKDKFVDVFTSLTSSQFETKIPKQINNKSWADRIRNGKLKLQTEQYK